MPLATTLLCCALASTALTPAPPSPEAARQERVLRALGRQERTQRLISGSTYVGTGLLYLLGAALLLSNKPLLTDPWSRSVSIEMLVFGPIEILYGLYRFVFADTYEKLARQLDDHPVSELMPKWVAEADSDRRWMRFYGISALVLSAGSLAFGIWALLTPAFNDAAVGMNAVFGVTSLAIGGLGIGYGIGALVGEPPMANLLEASGSTGAQVRFSLAPQPGGFGAAVGFAW